MAPYSSSSNDIPMGAAVGDPDLQLELCRGDNWNLTKKLTKADVNGSYRLLLPRGFVENHIFASVDPSFAERCRTIGVSIQVWDADEGSQYQLRLKKRNDNASFVLTGNRGLNFIEGDELGLTWDGSMLIMKLLKKN